MASRAARDERFWWRAFAACKHAPLALVDATYAKRKAASQEMRENYCHHCPVAQACLEEAMKTGEAGVWGETTQDQRTKHGSRSWRVARPDPERVGRRG